jgi:hypothetical protein
VTVTMNSTTFWNVITFISLEFYRRFGGTYRLRLAACLLPVSDLAFSLSLRVKAVGTFETSVGLYRLARNYDSEDSHRCDNLKFHHMKCIYVGAL